MRDTKQELIQVGAELFLRHSFQGTGLNDILKAAAVPKGSFYHHFSSKEEFGLAVIAHNTAQQKLFQQSTLGDTTQPPLERMRHYLDGLVTLVAQNGCELGCPIGTMAQEMAALSPPMREALESAFMEAEATLSRVAEEGQKSGDFYSDLPPAALARLIHCAVQGALIEAKALKNTAPLEHVAEALLKTLSTRPCSSN